MYKAIFLDLDGTLLDDDKNISEVNKFAIKKARENGVYVCLCSGRQKDAVNGFKQIAKSSRYIICSNGAQIYDCEKNEELFSCKIDEENCHILQKYVEENNLYAIIEDSYARYINSKEILKKYEIVLDNNEIKKLILENNILQFSIEHNTKKEAEKTIQYISSLNLSSIKIENFYRETIRGKEYWKINIINSNVSKGNAIYGLCKFLKIDIKDVIAIGDDKNDLSMIKNVGLGVAMGNAEEIVKENAKEVTKTNNENGVAEIINSKILSNS